MPSVQRQIPDSSSSKTKTEPGMISDEMVVSVVVGDDDVAADGDGVAEEEDEEE